MQQNSRNGASRVRAAGAAYALELIRKELRDLRKAVTKDAP
jgi:hypothetical protein